MNHSRSTTLRILAVALSTRGFGFAVLEGEKLVDWGIKTVTGNKNTRSLLKVEELLTLYHPTRLVLEDPSSTRRAARIHKLHVRLVTVAKQHKVTVKLLTRAAVREVFFADGEGTKHELAVKLVERFPQELKFRLPPKRRPWMSEDYRMGIFDAVALAITASPKKSHEI